MFPEVVQVKPNDDYTIYVYFRDGKKYIGGYLNNKREGFGMYYWNSPKKILMSLFSQTFPKRNSEF